MHSLTEPGHSRAVIGQLIRHSVDSPMLNLKRPSSQVLQSVSDEHSEQPSPHFWQLELPSMGANVPSPHVVHVLSTRNIVLDGAHDVQKVSLSTHVAHFDLSHSTQVLNLSAKSPSLHSARQVDVVVVTLSPSTTDSMLVESRLRGVPSSRARQEEQLSAPPSQVLQGQTQPISNCMPIAPSIG